MTPWVETLNPAGFKILVLCQIRMGVRKPTEDWKPGGAFCVSAPPLSKGESMEDFKVFILVFGFIFVAVTVLAVAELEQIRLQTKSQRDIGVAQVEELRAMKVSFQKHEKECE
jgi:hypothetical protein